MVQTHIPKVLRKPLYGQFGRIYNVKFDDMIENIDDFATFQEFFTRKVKPREINNSSDKLLSPADAIVLSVNKVDNNDILFIKGKTYSLCEFLNGDPHCSFAPQDIDHFFKKNPESDLYSMIMYLAPGDYHRFHSPCNFKVNYGKHVPGLLKPVNNLSLQNLKVN